MELLFDASVRLSVSRELPTSRAMASVRERSALDWCSTRQQSEIEHYRHLRAVAGRDAGAADQHRRRSAF
jgi:hypothetical protein